MTLKPKPRLAGNPLPKRNRKENLLKRTAAVITDQSILDRILAQQPKQLRVAWLEALRPYLRFEARELQS